MKKKLLTLFIVACLVCVLLPFGAFADSEASGTCGDDATWTFENGVLTISGTGEIEEGEWWDCEIKSVVINKGITSIGDGAFIDCQALESVNLPDSVKSIGDNAFCDCWTLKSITLPDGVKSIGDGAFQWCSGLAEVNIPDSVTSIGKGAFWGCDLKSFTIPDSVTSIGDCAFWGCEKLQNIDVSGNNTKFSSKDGVLFNKDQTKLRQYPAGKADTSYTVPSSVTGIEYGAFRTAKNLTSVTLPDGLKSIGERVFEYSNLTSINLPNGLESIGSGAFLGCEKLAGISLPGSMTDIEDGVFSSCVNLKSVNLPKSIKTIGENAFSDCENLKGIEIPTSVESIGDGAFQYCGSLTEINIPSGVKSIGMVSFKNCASLKNINVSDNNKNYSSEYGVLFNKDQTELKQYPLGKTDTSYRVPSSVTKIQYASFYAANNLNSVYIPKSVKSIGYYAFDCANNLKDMYYEGSQSQWEKIDSDLQNEYYDYFEENNVKLHFKATMPAEKKDPAPKQDNPFVDVKKDSYCYDAVQWAVIKNITNGMDATHFAPNNDCTRGQIVTFLWRAKGCPEVTGVKNPFKDVSKDAFYYKAVLWAVKNGITNGVDDTHFAPNQTCTRGQSVTFLWRADDSPKSASNKNPFKDVSKDAFYYNAMIWAVGQNITNGMDATHFAPGNTCVRGQIVTFLYRDMA